MVIVYSSLLQLKLNYREVFRRIIIKLVAVVSREQKAAALHIKRIYYRVKNRDAISRGFGIQQRTYYIESESGTEVY